MRTPLTNEQRKARLVRWLRELSSLFPGCTIKPAIRNSDCDEWHFGAALEIYDQHGTRIAWKPITHKDYHIAAHMPLVDPATGMEDAT